MRKDIRAFIAKCLVCQRAKAAQTHPASLLSPLSIPNYVWEDIAIDFITSLHISKRFFVIFVVIDHLSKYGHFAPFKASFIALQVAKTLSSM